MKRLWIIVFCLISSLSFSQNWELDFEHAKKQAREEQKQILLVFSGSDWCAPCIKLDQQIWQTETFQTHANDNLVLLRADFPKRKSNRLPKEQELKNTKLAELYNTEGYFPLVVLMNADGKVIHKLGYKNLSPEEYITAIYED